MLHVKICGLTNLDDALAAVAAGADLLGFNMYLNSPRWISPDVCANLISNLRHRLEGEDKHLSMVGVFVNHPIQQVIALMDRCGLDLAQLSGEEPAEHLLQLGDRAFKAMHTVPGQDIVQQSRQYPLRQHAPAFLVDAHLRGMYGGTGLRADWTQAMQLARRYPVLLAGGLTPANVAKAVRQVTPWGVDTASGVETSPGRKDWVKLEQFIRQARLADEEEIVE
jgi:phosphoribosylanthranilate isomerase